MNNRTRIGVFGYGSLVNRNTISSKKMRAFPVRLRGWKRQWKHCVDTRKFLEKPFGKVCSLTAIRINDQTEIEGLLLLVDQEGLKTFDKREIGYHREAINLEEMTIQPNLTFDAEGIQVCYTYAANEEYQRWGTTEFPILRSYIDSVLAGFLEVWGRTGVEKFVETTEGWDAPILDDRQKPIYPRAVVIQQSKREVLDQILLTRQPNLNLFSKLPPEASS